MATTYTINEVANIMGLTLKVVRRFVASGELKTTKKNNCYSVSEDDLESFKKYIGDGKHVEHAQEVADSFKSQPTLKLTCLKEQNLQLRARPPIMATS